MGDPFKILRMREAGHVTRCHCFPHHGHYDVAQHSFYMLLLLEELHPNPPRSLYSLILRHDLYERWTGDSPAAVKKILPKFRRELKYAEDFIAEKTGIWSCIDGGVVSNEDLAWLKALDHLEFLMWCDDQIAMGSKIAETKRKAVLDSFHEEWDRWPDEVISFLESYEWTRTNDDLS